MPTVVILLSDKRSGSTMLQDELCKHSGIRHVDYSPHTYFETHHWLKASVVLNRPDALYSGFRPYAGYGSRENARTYLIDTLKGNMPDYEPPENDEELISEGGTLCARPSLSRSSLRNHRRSLRNGALSACFWNGFAARIWR